MTVELNETAVRELAWVADVLTSPTAGRWGDLTGQELADLAEAIRHHVQPKVEEPKGLGASVTDKNGKFYRSYGYSLLAHGVLAPRWYLLSNGHALEVPWDSILEPTVQSEGRIVVR